MLDISEELKNIYKNDMFPLIENNVPKDLIFYIPELDLTIETDKIVDDSFHLEESLCSDNDLKLGSCESSQLKATVADITVDIKGKTLIVTQIINSLYSIPLGTYTIESVVKQSDLRFKEITAYDGMKKTDTDVSSWFNSLTFPISKKNMLISLLDFLGLEYEVQSLPNDSIMIDKTSEFSYLKGRDVLTCLCEISGGFGHITRTNKFKIILLSALGLYPSETLYPAEDLYPSESSEFITAGYMQTDYEEYTVEPITGVKIAQDDEDYGTTVGTTDNIYPIIGNFLLFGKPSTELQVIATNVLNVLKNKYYRPHKTKMIGLPYIEVGDAINIITTDDAIETFVFKRTFSGIQALIDDVSATGNQYRTNVPSANNEIQQLKGKTLKITKSIEELSSTITNVEENLESEITQQADEIALKVSKNEVMASINLSPETIKIAASKLELSGYATFTALGTPGATTIHGANLQTGTVVADSVRASWVYAGNINANQITAGSISGDRISGGTITGVTISGSTLVSTGSSHSTTIQNGTINTSYINVSQGSNYTTVMSSGITSYVSGSGQTSIIGGTIYCNQLNGHCSSAYSVRNTSASYKYAYLTVNDNYVCTSSDMYLGSSGSFWAGVYALNGTIITSDEYLKKDIKELDPRFLIFAKTIIPYTYQMLHGTSGRYHIGFIAQKIEKAMADCNISNMEFAGLIKYPVYSERIDQHEYDTTSEIIGYEYALRYEEFIPLVFLWLRDIESKIMTI